MSVSVYTRNYYEEVAAAAAGIDQQEVDRMIDIRLICVTAAAACSSSVSAAAPACRPCGQ